jgi:hypothetical protein
MSMCARCGAPVFDGDSWRRAYLSILEQLNRANRIVAAWQQLTDKYPVVENCGNKTFTLQFTELDLALMGIHLKDLLGK